jgi:prevent-host-death family protein
MEINVRDLRKNLATILRKAEHGEEITILRKGEAIVRLVPSKPLPGLDLDSLAAFRKDLNTKVKQNPVLSMREDERF